MKHTLRSSLLSSLTLLAAAVLAPSTLHATGDFYEEPLISLPQFLKLDQLPAKTFEQIFDETSPASPDAEPVDVAKEVAALKDKPGKDALAQIDKLLTRARAAVNTDALKVLNDLRDLYAGPATAAETAEYIAFRMGDKTADFAELDTRIAKASPALWKECRSSSTSCRSSSGHSRSVMRAS